MKLSYSTHGWEEKSWQEKIRQFMGGGMISSGRLLSDVSVVGKELQLLRRLEYDAVLPPFELNM